MKAWNGWTDKERDTIAYQTRKAIRAGLIPAKPSRCDRCGQTEGVLEWHNDNYSDPVKFLKGLCFRCHTVLHCEHLNPQSAKDYWDEIASGKQYPPVLSRNLGAVRRDHKLWRRGEGLNNRQAAPH